MAKVEKRELANGKISYRVLIRKKGLEISKTFANEEDANLYATYKEDLIQNMSNFDVPINERVTLLQVVELKLQETTNKEAIKDLEYSFQKIKPYIDINKNLHLITYDDWLNCAKNVLKNSIYRDGKSLTNIHKPISPRTVRNYFAYISSAFAHCAEKGIKLENFPLKVIGDYISKIK
jgi:hypothetical protein